MYQLVHVQEVPEYPLSVSVCYTDEILMKASPHLSYQICMGFPLFEPRLDGADQKGIHQAITIKKAVPTKFVLRPDHGDASWLLRMQYSLFEILVSGDIDSPCGQVVMTALCFFGIGSLDLV